MNNLVENNLITNMTYDDNVAYLLKERGLLRETEYKVLQSQPSGHFVKCMEMRYNGYDELYYMPGDLKTFESMIPNLQGDMFRRIVTNIVAAIIGVKNNGFLSCQNVDIAHNRIYVDPATCSVSLVYLPLTPRLYSTEGSFENAFRSDLIRVIDTVPGLQTAKNMQMKSYLYNGNLSMDDLYAVIKNGKEVPQQNEARQATRPQERAGHTGAQVRMVSLPPAPSMEIRVTKSGFVIGKKAETCNYVISFNKMISRTHCRIDCAGGQFTITDLKSANGTYLNGKRLTPQQSAPLHNGDTVRLANSDFQIYIS